ncbi:MAG: HNH endonuclease [Fimbriimonadaceae bacterium]|nr:HNH endonuclease [Fimbriimonadaceae bacterium]
MASFLDVPRSGPLSVGGIYKRASLHKRFGGNPNTGIVPSKIEPAILLFHTHEPGNQFYGDRFDQDGTYHFSGKGAEGDMRWNSENRSIRDHAREMRALLMFERYQRKGGYWQFLGQMICVGNTIEEIPDKNGKPRMAILFQLLPIDEPLQKQDELAQNMTVRELRKLAYESSNIVIKTGQSMQTYFQRENAIRQYALERAAGICEACNQPAPFTSVQGYPFLEVHHLSNLADGGPDVPDGVAAVCPNCHRRCHYGQDATEYNSKLVEKITAKEHSLSDA